MCGRYTLTARPKDIAELMALDELEGFPPRYNIAPSQPILIILGGRDERPDALSAGREGRLVRWGFLPAWLNDAKGYPLTFNARSETAAEKNSFRAAMRYRRCLVPASGFYEWRREAGARKGQPFFVRPRSGQPIAFAGIMETWHAADGSEIDTAAILTTRANAALSGIHERMPVTIPATAFARWLDCRTHAPAGVADLLVPAGEDVFEAVPVSDAVNTVANVGPDVQTRITVPADVGSGRDETPAQGSLF